MNIGFKDINNIKGLVTDFTGSSTRLLTICYKAKAASEINNAVKINHSFVICNVSVSHTTLH